MASLQSTQLLHVCCPLPYVLIRSTRAHVRLCRHKWDGLLHSFMLAYACTSLTMQMYMDQKIHLSLQCWAHDVFRGNEQKPRMSWGFIFNIHQISVWPYSADLHWYKSMCLTWSVVQNVVHGNAIKVTSQVLLNEMSTFLTHLPIITCVQCIKVWEVTRKPTDVGNSRTKGDYENHMCLCRDMMMIWLHQHVFLYTTHLIF